jgi:hypothetical protein
MAFTFYLGPAGALVAIKTAAPEYASARTRLGGTHETLAGRLIRDTIGYRRQMTYPVAALTAEQYSDLEELFELPGPYRFVDPTRRNLLTANQASGTDALLDATGWSARTQGTVSSSTAQARSGVRSLAWATGTALGSTGRGIVLVTAISTIDSTWAAVPPSTDFNFSIYARTSAAVTMAAGIEWRDAAGALLSTSTGTGVALSTSAWTGRPTVTGTSPSTVAYAVPILTNTTITGAAITVFADDPQLEFGTAATNQVHGTGVPIVSVDSLIADYSNFYADAVPPLFGATLVLLEL